MTNKPIEWVEYKTRELKITRKKAPPFEEWMNLFDGMDVQIVSDPFWRADVMIIGILWYGEAKATAIIDDQHGTAKTWSNALSIGLRIPPNGISVDSDLTPHWNDALISRRREELSWSIHCEVAYLDPEDFQDSNDVLLKSLTAEGLQSHYLQMSIDNMFTVSDLRKQIKSDKGILPSFVDAMEKIAAKLEKLTDDLPDDWEAEAMHLENAYHQVEFAIESGRNREIGEPAEIRIELPQEVEA